MFIEKLGEELLGSGPWRWCGRIASPPSIATESEPNRSELRLQTVATCWC